MKKLLKNLMMVAALVCGTMSMTSCDEIMETIFGEWDKPTPQSSTPDSTPTPEEMLTNLSAALEEGALVTITYTVDGVTYTSTFKKVGDEYVEQSTTSAARALTRASTSIRALIYYLGADNSYNFRAIEDEKIVLNVQIDVATATTTTTFSSNGATFGGMTVNGKPVLALSGSNKWINVIQKISGTTMGVIGCKAGETWSDYVGKQSKNGHMIIQIIGSDVFYSNGGITGQLYKDPGCADPVTPGGTINNDVFIELSPESYQKASWNKSTKKVDYTSVSTDNYTLVSPSDGYVRWSGGTYVVKDNVTIGDQLDLNGDVNLILCDGATLKVNGKILGYGLLSLTIYSQSQGDTAGKLKVKKGLDNLNYLTIHGGNITVESGSDGINNSPLTVYGGKLSITTDGSTISTGSYENVKVYGGEVNAISKKNIAINLDDGASALTVFGGKVTAQGGIDYPAIKGSFAAGEGTNIVFSGSDDGNTWTPITTATSDKRYFKAEPATAPATIAVTGVSLNKTSLDLTVGGTATLKATVAPLDATNQDVTWESNNTAAATVDQNGAVKAVGVGEATITVTTMDGSKTATCKVTVKAATIAVTGVSLNKTSLDFTVGDSETLKATVAPNDATNKDVTWESNNTAAATVDQNGAVKAVGVGEATITVTTKDGSKTATCKVTVKAKGVVEDYSVKDSDIW